MADNFSRKLDKFFLTFLIINPFLDVISGVYIKVLETLSEKSFDTISIPVTPSLLIRMAVLVLFALYAIITIDKKALATAIPVGIAWALSVAGEILFFYSFNLYTDIQYIARFAYNLAVVLIYMAVFRRMGVSREQLLKRLQDVLCFSLLLLSATIVISYLFGLGYTTYADRYGYRGTRGFFYSGNDITAILMAGLPVVMCSFMQLKDFTPKKYIQYNLSSALTVICLMLIGTKTAFISVIVTVAVLAACGVWRLIAQKDKTLLMRLAVIMLSVLIIFGLIAVFASESIFSEIRTSFMSTSNTAEREGAATALLSGRQVKLKRAFTMFKDGGVFTYLFGVGRGTQSAIIEMDIFEVVLYYGIVGAVLMLWLYISLGLGFVINFFKNLGMLKADLMPMACLVSLALCAGYMLIAGHILFSVTSGFYFSYMLLFGKVIYTKDAAKLAIF
ncbi:MAG: O-antigen ligase family protein [Clostridiaceae bacterium]|nr:O-antigen ligase family protein [Clostridiaceae bacterium]